MAAGTVPWITNGEAVAGLGAATDVVNRVSRYFLTQSGISPDTQGFTGFAPVFNVKSWGCKVDGVTDDTVNFKACLADAVASGGKARVYVPEGTMIVDSSTPIYVKGGVSLEGAGRGRTIIKRKSSSSTTDLLYFGDPAVTQFDIVLKDFTLDGNRANETPAGSGVVAYYSNITGLLVSNVEYRNSPFFAQSCHSVKYAQFHNVSSHDSNRDAFTTADGSQYIVFTNILSHDSGDDGMAFVGTSLPVSHIAVTGYTSYRSGMNTSGGGPGGTGLKFAGQVSYVTVVGFDIDYSASNGIRGESLGGIYPQHIYIEGSISNAGQLASATVKAGVYFDGVKNLSGRVKVVGGTAEGLILTGPAIDVALHIDAYGCAFTGAKLDGTAARLTSIALTGSAKMCGTSGVLAEKVDGLTLDGFVAVNNATLGSVGASTQSGAYINNCTNVVVTGGRFSQDNAAATNKQAYGLLINTGNVDVTVVGAVGKGNTSSDVGFASAATGQFRMEACTGMLWNSMVCNSYVNGVTTTFGNGAPGFVSAKGSIHRRLDGGANTTLYVNETGTGVWAAK